MSVSASSARTGGHRTGGVRLKVRLRGTTPGGLASIDERDVSEPIHSTRTIPVVEEVVTADKVVATTDHVRVRTSIETTEVLVEDLVDRETLKVDRLPRDYPVEFAPPPRQEGDTTIVSLVEERLVVEKRLFVVEEIHVTRERTQERVTVPVTLRATRAAIERPLDSLSKGRNTND